MYCVFIQNKLDSVSWCSCTCLTLWSSSTERLICYLLPCSFPEQMPLAARLYLPPDDSSALSRQHVWYAALPLLLYIIGSAIVTFYTAYETLVFAVLGRVFALLFSK